VGFSRGIFAEARQLAPRSRGRLRAKAAVPARVPGLDRPVAAAARCGEDSI